MIYWDMRTSSLSETIDRWMEDNQYWHGGVQAIMFYSYCRNWRLFFIIRSMLNCTLKIYNVGVSMWELLISFQDTCSQHWPIRVAITLPPPQSNVVVVNWSLATVAKAESGTGQWVQEVSYCIWCVSLIHWLRREASSCVKHRTLVKFEWSFLGLTWLIHFS